MTRQATTLRQADGVAFQLSTPRREETAPLETPDRVLAIGAHPDDVELLAGATVARWARAGAAVTIVVASDGRAGTWDTALDDAELAAQRAREAHQAAQILHADLWLLGVPDGRLAHTHDLSWRVAAAIRRARPDVVLAHDPWHPSRSHPDHRAIGLATLDALALAREPVWSPWLHSAHRPTAVLFFETPAPNHAEPADATSLALKVEALACHRSQYRTTYGIRAGDDPKAVLSLRVEARMRHDAQVVGASNAALTENFRIVDDL